MALMRKKSGDKEQAERDFYQRIAVEAASAYIKTDMAADAGKVAEYADLVAIRLTRFAEERGML